MDNAEFSDFPKMPNGKAYEKTEVRTGPPLAYVAEKLHNSLLFSHSTFNDIEEYVPNDLPQPLGAEGTTFSTKHSGLLPSAHATFHYALVAYLALNNMLGLGKPDLTDSLLQMPYEDFKKWLEGVSSNGLVSG